jgi:cellulose synthase/poly-beta-1,6-N-acetylglucosamine synthase-like glycosyltransferase
MVLRSRLSIAVDRADLRFVSVIILNCNGLRFAEQCVRSVLDSDYSKFEVVVVDNGSTDGSYEGLSQSFSSAPNLKIVRNYRNLGFAEGNNVGYRNSKGEIVVFLNVDTRVERGVARTTDPEHALGWPCWWGTVQTAKHEESGSGGQYRGLPGLLRLRVPPQVRTD